MKAVLVKEPGGVDQLYIGEQPKPEPEKGELLVKVKATAVNRADIAQREGKYPPPKGASPIMGLEMAGIVETVGKGCSTYKPGDRVFGLLGGGGYAEYTVIPENMALPLPEHLSFEEATAIPEVFLTGYQTLFWIGQLQKGERVLIHAGGSGVGTAAIQMAKARGAEVVITAGSEEKLEKCRELDADLAINYKEGPFEPVIQEKYGKASIDLILDFIGAPYWEQNLSAFAMDGRLVLISTLGGAKLTETSLGMVMAKRLTISGTTLRSRTLDYKIKLTKEFSDWALPLFETGELKPIMDKVYPIDQIKEAHNHMEQNRNFGKIILSMDSVNN